MNISIVLLSTAMTAALLYTQLGAYFRKSVYDNLLDRANEISQVSAYVIDSVHDSMERVFLTEIIEIANTEASNGIIVTDKRGNVIAVSGFEEGALQRNFLEYNDIASPLYGENAVGESNLSGFLNQRLLYAMVPIQTNHGTQGVVVVCSTDMSVRYMQIDVMVRFFWVVWFVIMLTFIVSAILSKRIAKPIREITVAARRIASGDFSQRVGSDNEGELKVLTDSFNQMSAALAEMDDNQSSFISDVSHELRTPMTIISGFVDGILDGTIPESEHRKYLEIVLREVKRLSRLVNDLLEMSRLNSGKIEYKMLPFDVNESVRRAVVAFGQGLEEKDLEVEVNFEKDPMSVMGNSDSIYRVITNLLDNAVKFTPEKGYIKIDVSASGGKTRVSIENSGKGLSEKELLHIWDRFYQTDKSRSSEKKGAGLGLYIVKNIMQAHNNEIFAESEEGKYTRFVFELDSVKTK